MTHLNENLLERNKSNMIGPGGYDVSADFSEGKESKHDLGCILEGSFAKKR